MALPPFLPGVCVFCMWELSPPLHKKVPSLKWIHEEIICGRELRGWAGVYICCVGAETSRPPWDPGQGSRATPCPRSRGRGRVTPGGRLGWGSVEHSVPAVTTHVESVCRVSGGLIYSVFTWPSRSDAFRSQILLQIISSQTRATHSGRRDLAHGDLGVPSPWLPPLLRPA